jgi:hypothetical protein
VGSLLRSVLCGGSGSGAATPVHPSSRHQLGATAGLALPAARRRSRRLGKLADEEQTVRRALEVRSSDAKRSGAGRESSERRRRTWSHEDKVAAVTGRRTRRRGRVVTARSGARGVK